MNKYLLGMLCFFTFSSCAHRGLKVGQQIPEYHEQYDKNKDQMFAKNYKDVKRVVYRKSGDQEQRALAYESSFIDENIKKNDSPELVNFNRQIASVSSFESALSSDDGIQGEVIHSAPKEFYEKNSSKYNYKPKQSSLSILPDMALQSIALKYFGDEKHVKNFTNMNGLLSILQNEGYLSIQQLKTK